MRDIAIFRASIFENGDQPCPLNPPNQRPWNILKLTMHRPSRLLLVQLASAVAGCF
jgi:hypothetical protein